MVKRRKKWGRFVEPDCILCEEIVLLADKKFRIPIEWVRLESGVSFSVHHDFIVHRLCYDKSTEDTRESAIKRHIMDLL